jgi:DNA-directed RNA polymerase specialized sigma subunit
VDYVLGYFGREATAAQKKYSEFVNALIDKEYDSPLKEAVASTILGGIEFINEIKDKYLRGKNIDRNLPALRELTKTSIEEIIREVEGALEKSEVLPKKAAIYLCHRYSGRTLREIGGHFGIGESAVSQTSRRFSVLLDKDKKLNKKIKYICNRLKFV